MFYTASKTTRKNISPVCKFDAAENWFRKVFRFTKNVSKAIRFWDFSYETVYETKQKKAVSDEKGLFLLLIRV